MRSQLSRFLQYFLFWMIFFLIAKALFLIWNFETTSHLSVSEISGIFWHGLKMDISIACYLLILPGLLLVLRIFLPSTFVNRFVYGYTLIFLIVASMLVVLDLGLYPHWGTRVNVTIFNYIGDPVAVGASVSFSDVLLGLLLGGSLIGSFLYLFRFLFPEGVVCAGNVKWGAALFQLFLVAALILPIRGGLDTSPLNLSSVAFSTKLYVNQAASNYLWNFAKSVEKRKRFANPCEYMEKDESLRIFNEFQEQDTLVERPALLKLQPNKQPNVILVILEGFSNKVIAELGGLNGIAPN